jgi:competence protein ComEC
MKDKFIRQGSAVLAGGFLCLHLTGVTRYWVLAFLVLFLLRFWFLWKPIDFYGRWLRPEILLLICSLLAGFFYAIQAEKNMALPLSLNNVTVIGELSDWTKEETRARGVFRLEQAVFLPGEDSTFAESLGRKYTLNVYGQGTGGLTENWQVIKPGDRISFTGKIDHPQPPGTAGTFNLPLFNSVRGLSGSITAWEDVTLLEKGVPPLGWQIRQKVRTVLDKWWPQDAGILEGILFGDSSRIPPDTLDMYKAAGVMHVFAASGANVAFVIALAWVVFFFLPLRGRIVITIGLIVLYAVLCKANPPILRASILGTAVLLGMMGKGRVSSLRWLVFAAILLFFRNPLYLQDVSFQLSFAATWGIVVLSPRIFNTGFLQKFPKVFRLPASVAFAVQIAALPVMIDVFNRMSLAGFATNIFILVVLGAVLQLAIIGTVFLLLPVLPLAFFQVCFWLLKIAGVILEQFSSLPFAYFWVLNPGKLFWFMWYALLAVFLTGREKCLFIFRVQLRKLRRLIIGLEGGRYYRLLESACRKTGGRSAVLLTALLFILLLWSPWHNRDTLEITFVDVGQGDAILISTSREDLLVDTGPKSDSFNAGERIIIPYLMKKRISFLDMLFITHEHSDHIGGAEYIMANIPTGKVCIPDVGERLLNEEWQEGLLRNLEQKDPGKLVKLRAGDSLSFSSGLFIEVLSPREILSLTPSDANNNSLVLRLTYLNKRILLAGDMELDQIRAVAERGIDCQADFIKLPHHGAEGSLDTAWFDRANPQAVFIQVGRNSFGHPSPEVLAYWGEREVPLFRTDIQGTIELIIDNKGFHIISGRT